MTSTAESISTMNRLIQLATLLLLLTLSAYLVITVLTRDKVTIVKDKQKGCEYLLSSVGITPRMDGTKQVVGCKENMK